MENREELIGQGESENQLEGNQKVGAVLFYVTLFLIIVGTIDEVFELCSLFTHFE